MKKALIFVKLREQKLAQQICQLLYVTKMLQLLVVMDRVRSFVGSRIASRLFKTRVTQTPKQKVRNGRQFFVLLYKINTYHIYLSVMLLVIIHPRILHRDFRMYRYL